MCKVRKVGFEGAGPTFATRRPPRVTFTFGEFCNRFSGGNGFAAKAASWGQNAKDYVVGGCIRSLRDARVNGLMPRPKATDTKIGLYCPFFGWWSGAGTADKICTFSFTNGNDIPHLKGDDSEAQ